MFANSIHGFNDGIFMFNAYRRNRTAMGDIMSNIEKIIIVAIVVLIGLMIAGLIAEHREWLAFKDEHECYITNETTGSYVTGTGIAMNGKVSVINGYVPGKTGWLCNDGVTYWR